MFKFIKDLFRSPIKKEYEVVCFLIDDSSTTEDFIIAKKRLIKFYKRWNDVSYMKKLYVRYNKQLAKKRQTSLNYGIKKKKERKESNKKEGRDMV